MLRMPWLGMAVWIVALGMTARAQLATGDIAFVAYHSDGSNDFAWVALRRIPADTTINFTDMSVSNGAFRLSEHSNSSLHGPLSWRYANVLDAGSVVRWSGVSRVWSIGQATGDAPDLSSDGDQLIAYCGVIVSNAAFSYPWSGDSCGAKVLHALNFANSGWDNVTGGSAQKSFVPPGLSMNSWTAVHVSNKDNGYYSGVTSGTAAELLKAIANPANWTVSDTEFETFYWTGTHSFQVQPRGLVMSIR